MINHIIKNLQRLLPMKRVFALAISCLLWMSSPALAQEAEQLKKELQELKQEYQVKLAELEKRLAAIEQQAANKGTVSTTQLAAENAAKSAIQDLETGQASK